MKVMEGETRMLSVEKAKSDTNDIISKFDHAISEAETATPRQRRSPADGKASSERLSARDSKVREGESLSTASLLTLFDEAIHSSLKGVKASPSPVYSSTSANVTATTTATGSFPSIDAAWLKALDSPSDGFLQSETCRAPGHEGQLALAQRNHDGSKHHDMEASLDPYLSRQIGGRKATSPADAAAAAQGTAGDAGVNNKLDRHESSDGGVNHKVDRLESSNSTSVARCLEAPPDSPAKHPNPGSKSGAAKDAGAVQGLPDATDGTSVPDTTQDDKTVKHIPIPLFPTVSSDDSNSSSTEVITRPRPEEGAEERKRDADWADSKIDTKPSENDNVVVSRQPSTVEAVISSHLAGKNSDGEQEDGERAHSTISEMVQHGGPKRNSDGSVLSPPNPSTSSARRSKSMSNGSRENLCLDVEISQFNSRPSISVSRPSMQKRRSGSYTPRRQSFTKSTGSPVQAAAGMKDAQRKISISSDTGSYLGSLVDSKAASFNVSVIFSCRAADPPALAAAPKSTCEPHWTSNFSHASLSCIRPQILSTRKPVVPPQGRSHNQSTLNQILTPEPTADIEAKIRLFCGSESLEGPFTPRYRGRYRE